MNKVDRCDQSPFHCAVFPTLGAQQMKGYYRTDTVLPGPGIHEHTVYVSVEAVETLARREGWVSPQEHERLLADVDRMSSERDVLQEHLDAAEAVVDAIESRDFRARKKPGRAKTAA